MIHRVGGLEEAAQSAAAKPVVIHRVGGLEAEAEKKAKEEAVIHRVGGLEVIATGSSMNLTRDPP